jgi:hypothetical protein
MLFTPLPFSGSSLDTQSYLLSFPLIYNKRQYSYQLQLLLSTLKVLGHKYLLQMEEETLFPQRASWQTMLSYNQVRKRARGIRSAVGDHGVVQYRRDF